MTVYTKQVRLRARPSGIPQAEHFEIVRAELPPVQAGQILVRNHFLSVEPGMRGWVSSERNYRDPVLIGAVMPAQALGRVEQSACADVHEGSLVTGMFGWAEHAVVGRAAIQRVVVGEDVPATTSLGVLGINGFTAHCGLLEIGQARPGETVVVSTAAGAVGSCAGQIGKILGCRVVGITGGAAKRAACVDFYGFDAAVDYKSLDFADELAAACPQGIDVYFDNTSGAVSDQVMQHLRVGARVVVCGTAAVASWDPIPQGARIERHLLVKRARMQGFMIFDHADRFDEMHADLLAWLRAGRIRYLEDILSGIESAPDSIAGLYRGENLGKRLIRLV